MLPTKKFQQVKVCHALLGKIVELSFKIKGEYYKELWSFDTKVNVSKKGVYHARAEIKMEECHENSKIEKTPLEVLVVGTGRDGTTSLSFLLTEMSVLNGNNKRCIHEYTLTEFNKRIPDYLTTGEDKSLVNLLNSWSTWSVSSAGYGLILPIFFKVFGNKLKIIHLKRNKDTYIASAKKRLITQEKDYYSNGDMGPPTAYHYREMSRETWSKLSIDEKLCWYYEKVHTTIERDSALFENVLQVKTETLNDPQTIKTITGFVNSTWKKFPKATHQHNTGFINHTNFSKVEFIIMAKLFDDLNFHRALKDGRYLIQYLAKAAADNSIVAKKEDLKLLQDCIKILN